MSFEKLAGTGRKSYTNYFANLIITINTKKHGTEYSVVLMGQVGNPYNYWPKIVPLSKSTVEQVGQLEFI
ncbi:Uncharacterised protein [Legionella pneumophila]|nr:Uncharacterised protein [Legionella pneumophila]